MKTLTEFFGTTLKAAQKAKDELVQAGKTAEELAAGLTEALKVEGEKLTHLVSALDAVESKWENLKRVVVLSLSEGEAAPKSAKITVGSHAFVVEYYPPLVAPGRRGAPSGDRGKDARGRDGGKRGGKRDGKKRDGAGRPARAPSDSAAPRSPRAARPPKAAEPPYQGENRIKFGAASAAAPSAGATSSAADSAPAATEST